MMHFEITMTLKNLIILFIISLLEIINILWFYSYSTKRNKYDMYYSPKFFVIIYVFAGFLLLPFHKRINEYIKINYYKNKIFQYEDLLKHNLINKKEKEKLLFYKRYVKLKKIKK